MRYVALFLSVLGYGFIVNASAQQPTHIDRAIMSRLGELQFNNAIMEAELKRVSEENTKLRAELEGLRKGNGGTDGRQGSEGDARVQGR